MSSASESPVPEWRRLYERAVAETDDSLIRQRIAEAEDAIIQRSRELARIGRFDAEDAELAGAIISLYDLRRRVPERRMHRRPGPIQHGQDSERDAAPPSRSVAEEEYL